MPRRSILIVATASLLAIVSLFVYNFGIRGENRRATVPTPAPSGWQPIGMAVSMPFEDALANGVLADPSLPDREDLRKLCRVTAHAVLGAKFEAYDREMTERGLALTERADALAKQEMSSSRYPRADVAALEKASLRERIKYIWENPDARNVAVSKVGVDQIKAGKGWSLDADWTKHGVAGAVCMYLPGRKSDDVFPRAARGELPTAWVECDVTLASGNEGRCRITFCYDAERGHWLPLRLDLVRGAVVPML
jgi:hypothetical protein